MSNFIGYGIDAAKGETRRAAMVMITDGQSNAGWIPERFALWEPGDPPYQDGPELPAGSTDPDPTDNKPWNLGISQRLSLAQRKEWKGLIVPSVSCLAVGEIVDAAPLQIIADASGGSLQYSDTSSNTTVLSLKRQVAQGVATAVGRQRASSVLVPSALPSALPAVTSELGARELVVSVSSATPGLESLKLVSPGGASFAATQVTGDAVVFRIPHPAAGAWSWSQGAAMGAPADALVETQLSTDVQLFAFADVVDRNPLPGPGDNSGTFESGRYTFKPVCIIATVEGATITSATATLRAPPGVTTPLTLVDDGEHGDGLPGDGVFGIVVANGQTAWVGVYGVTMAIAGTLPDGTAFTRVRDLAFELHAGGDLDGDGLPDWWEKDKGTKMATPDAADDPDGDGLENRRELEAGTSPLSADSDGGGESDGSEVFAGRDPLDSSDDGTKPSLVQVFPGVGKVVVVVPMPAQEVSLVQIARSPTQNGAYDRLSVQRRRGAPLGRLAFEGAAATEEPGAPSCVEREGQPFVFDCAAEEAREACYQVSVGTASGHSGWSSAACVTPRLDPFPPRVEGVSVVAGGGRTRGVTLRVQASDDPLGHDRSAQAFLDPAIVASGVAEVMVATRDDFSDGTWASPSEELHVWLPPTPRSAAVFVKARDAHGNESGPRTFWIPFVQHTPIDEAIGIEERALDELRAGDATRARASLAVSIVRITTSLSRIHARIKAPGAADPTDVELFAGLGAVVAKKEAARVLLAVKRPKEAEALLRAAIAVELALAQLAERTGREL